ncbi:MAG TPA: Spy/CpxP family protein refolding chaperone [Pyrinomonadaceae bacterium]|nr:Spy/CpxP family protein refolding chaperone [Pyrinomonadaceae bacterium]
MKLTGTRKIAGALAFSAVMALTGVTGFAQQQTTQGQEGGKARGERRWGGKGFGDRRGGLMGGRFAEQLNLTDAQKEQIKQIATRYRESAKAQRGERRGQRARGFDAFGGGTFNEAEVRAAAQARANAQVERQVAHARMMSEIYNVLTAEQKAQLATLRQQREQKMQERRARRSSGQTTQQQ